MKQLLQKVMMVAIALLPNISLGGTTVTTVEAPPLLTCKITSPQNLGIWDDAAIIPNKEEVLLLKGESVYRLAMQKDSQPKLLIKAPIIRDSSIKCVIGHDQQLWLFANTPKSAPYAFNLTSGKVVTFEIPNLAIPGSHTPTIQSVDVASHLGGVIISVSGGDKTTWPRDGNRPIYFWLNLKSDEMIRMPTGWDMNYFSTDLQTAFLSGKSNPETYRRARHAIDMKTGQASEGFLNQHTHPYVPYNWSDTQLVKPCYIRNGKGEGDTDYIAGVYYGGKASIFASKVEPKAYMSTTDYWDGIIGFRQRRSGISFLEPDTLWFIDINSNKQPVKIAEKSLKFTMLEGGNSLYSVGDTHLHKDTFFHIFQSGMRWNILDEVELLKSLPANAQQDDRIDEKIQIDFIRSNGNRATKNYALCFIRHTRIHPDTLKQNDRFLMGIIPRELSKKVILITGDGRRFMTPLSQDDPHYDLIWPFSSGELIKGEYLWGNDGGPQRRKIKLYRQSVSHSKS